MFRCLPLHLPIKCLAFGVSQMELWLFSCRVPCLTSRPAMLAAKLFGWEPLLRDHGAGEGAWMLMCRWVELPDYVLVFVYLRDSATGKTLAYLQQKLLRARQVRRGSRSAGRAEVGRQSDKNKCWWAGPGRLKHACCFLFWLQEGGGPAAAAVAQ